MLQITKELDSIYQVPVSLDSDSSAVPLHLKIYPFRYLHSSSYTTADVGDYFSSLLAEKEVNNQFGLSKPVLMDYIKATARFTITDYKNCLLDEWVQNKLIPNLNCQLSILIEWVDVRQRYADVSFNQLLDSHRSFLFNQMEVNDWDISDFRHKVTMAMIFLVDEMAPLSVLNQRILHLKRVLRQLDYGLNAGDLFLVKQNYQTPFIAISEDIQYWDAQLLMFPYLQWVTHWHDFLQRYYRSYSQPLIQRLKHDLSYPKQLYEMFKSGPMVFLDYLVSND